MTPLEQQLKLELVAEIGQEQVLIRYNGKLFARFTIPSNLASGEVLTEATRLVERIMVNEMDRAIARIQEQISASLKFIQLIPDKKP